MLKSFRLASFHTSTIIQENASKRIGDVQMSKNIVNTGNKQLNQHVFSALNKNTR